VRGTLRKPLGCKVVDASACLIVHDPTTASPGDELAHGIEVALPIVDAGIDCAS